VWETEGKNKNTGGKGSINRNVGRKVEGLTKLGLRGLRQGSLEEETVQIGFTMGG